MALVFTLENISSGDGSVKLAKWAGLSASDTASAIEFVEWGDRSVQITGTFNAGTVTLEGSNDGTNWVTLADPQGNAISKTSAAIEQVLELTRYMRPKCVGAGMTIDVNMVLRRGNNLRA